MQLADIMATDVVSIGPGSSVGDAARRMIDRDTGVAVVLDDGKLVGVLSERDLLRLIAEHGDLGQAVRDRMTREVVTAGPATDLAEALAMMMSGRFRHLPVTDGDRVVGIVSMRDLMAWTAQRLRQGPMDDDLEFDSAELVATIHRLRTGAN